MAYLSIHNVKNIVMEKKPHKLDTGTFVVKITIENDEGNFEIDLFSDEKESLKILKD